MGKCPECDARFPIDEEELEEGDFIDCPECAVSLEVIDLDPLRFEAVPDDDYDSDEGIYDEDDLGGIDEDSEDWD